MSTDKLQRIVSMCACSVYVSINEHKSTYDSVAQFIVDESRDGELVVSEAELAEMEATDTVVSIQAYQHTPIGFIKVYAATLDAALDETLAALGERS